ncbi:hypothetical protein DLAC_00411 [Tieghemostelium lacteum]|uniref:FNIP repeat-containing protein n=1 Tax=Tieghemostelium lacteum TaxID=361077 RepID=A0A152A9X6_TIELA|nr:hypothetical protein DLAC_00411 [Tieghemostelium lacteum]|eukprot:KYR02931.1 hypothetical protein DLAC_00411 [Tieghemostelium lacteum]
MVVITNVVLFREILKYVKYDYDIFALISTCKLLYSFRDKIRFNKFPVIHFMKVRELSQHNLPKFYRKIKLNHESLFSLWAKHIKPHFNILKLNCIGNYTPKLNNQIIEITNEITSIRLPPFTKTLKKQPLPPNLKTLSTSNKFQDVITQDQLPKSLKKLTLNHEFNDNNHLLPNSLPESLEELNLNTSYLHPLNTDILPKSLKTLSVKYLFNHPIQFASLHNLEYLDLGNDFNQELTENMLPPNLKTLILRWLFNNNNKPIRPGVFPMGLTYLRMGYHFEQEITEFPTSLKFLYLGGTFNFPLKKGLLKEGLLELILSSSYTQPIEPGVLPSTLTYIELPHRYREPLKKGVLPPNLKRLKGPMPCLLDESLPQGVLTVTLYKGNHSSYPMFPNSIRKMNIHDLKGGKLHQLPNQLEKLFVDHGVIPVDILPLSLKKLRTGVEFNHPLKKGVLPQNLEKLILGNSFNSELVLPQSLKILELGNRFNQNLNLPEGLESLLLGNDFKQPITFPSSLQYLTYSTRCHLDPNSIPKNLKRVYKF